MNLKKKEPGRAVFLKLGFFASAALFLIFTVSGPSSAGIFSSEKDITGIFEEIEANGADKGAVEELEKHLEKNPNGEYADEALIKLGYIYSQRKEFNRAAQAYQRLIENFPMSRFKFDALYELGNLRYRTGALKDARSLLESVSASREATAGLRAKARLILKDMEASTSGQSADAPAIGALLPMKGSYAQFGEDALNGVLLAAGVFGEKGGPFEVIVKNVGSDPASIEGAVDDLASNQKVIGLVGPLVSATSLETVRYAQKKRIPIITLSQKEGITQAGDYVFRNSLTPSAQAGAIAEYAVKKLGNKRFAILYPQNNYGTELARLFEKEVRDQGGTVVRELSYPQGNRDFSDQMKYIFGIQVKEKKEGRKRVREYNPAVTVDALYVPDFYDAAALIAPYLEYYNIKGVQLLGSNGWNSGKLVQLAGKNVEGAVFVDGFFPGSSRAGTEEFTRSFREAYGRDPGVLEAQAYDSAKVLMAAATEGKEVKADRDAVKTGLRSIKDFKGAGGSMAFDVKGEALKKLFILTVKDGRIVEAPGS